MRVLGADTRSWTYGDPDGGPIVFVHGFRGDHHGLDGIARALSESMPELRIHVPDLPGFGDSPAIPSRTHDLSLFGEWLREYAQTVAPHARTILGHSFGSLVVASALKSGLTAARTILINPISSPALKGPQAALTQAAILYYRAADALPEPAARALLGNKLIVRGMSEVMAKTGDRELRKWIHDQHEQYFSRFVDSSTLLEAFRASVSHTVPEFAGALTMPVLLIAGEKDDITPLAHQLDLQRMLPNAQLQIFPDTGHLVHYEAVPDAILEIRSFLRRTEEQAA
ncbi:alpha/beta hydrolase [Leucobacter denitrificans]|uniref:Alpha/beta hydrolase n=1 Tax=Leucobacter denitrificans TaxID=683042 RepID=A0A7G9S7L4_9MICO|nr:alpha/beta hydrolase [Leucobacter denitrificans]